jgi:hypothetical protein
MDDFEQNSNPDRLKVNAGKAPALSFSSDNSTTNICPYAVGFVDTGIYK